MTEINNIDVSIVIVNWNTEELLFNCIRSIYHNLKGLGFEIIVIDNASSDGSVEMLRKKFSLVKLIVNDKNRGFAAANNQGISASGGRYVLLLNSDTEILPASIENTVAFADLNADAAVVGCRVLNGDRTLQATCFMFPSLLNMFLSAGYLYKVFAKNVFFGREQMTWWDRADSREVDVVTGCFMLVRRRAIEKVGLMDEGFFMYAEETDWCYRFKKAGWKVMFAPAGEIIHLGGRSSKKVRTEMIIQLRLSILKFFKKHYGWLKHKTACLLVILFFAVRLPIWFFASVFGGRNKKQAAVKLRAYLNGIISVFEYDSFLSKEAIA